MPTEILAIGSGAADSSDVVVDAGEVLTVCLKDAVGPRIAGRSVVQIRLKDDDGQYFTVDNLDRHKPAVAIVAPGTYSFHREAGGSCGVFSG